VTPTKPASSPLDAMLDPQTGQNPRHICGNVSNQVGSPPGPVHSNPSSGKDTHDITGAPESRWQCSHEHSSLSSASVQFCRRSSTDQTAVHTDDLPLNAPDRQTVVATIPGLLLVSTTSPRAATGHR